jgi:uncharacterized protein (DUF2252 family)
VSVAVQDRAQVDALSTDERARRGHAARLNAKRSSHGDWSPAPGRPDPVSLLEEQARTRLAELVPIRYGRMLSSPFAFYRGAALVMASDLATTPVSGIDVQACGDAHVSNFGVFAGPDRELVFDVNDFDETARGPWEWDVKRLAASLEIAGRDRNFTAAERTGAVLDCVRAYRDAMARFAQMGNLECWYTRMRADALVAVAGVLTRSQQARTRAALAKAQRKTSSAAIAKLTVSVNGSLRFASQPPLLVPVSELVGSDDAREAVDEFNRLLDLYAASLAPPVRHLLSSYRFVDLARKVVGVGSVGTRAWIGLLTGRDDSDPLVLQGKEAEASVLERFVGASSFEQHGERVVEGQRLMQAASDVLLGWLRTPGFDGVVRDFYIRQLWDAKGSADVETILPSGLQVYGQICAQTLARGHARSGDRVAIAAYLGGGDSFPAAIRQFALAYADQNERDHRSLEQAARSGRITVMRDI